MTVNILAAAAAVLHGEAKGLEALAASLDDNFTRAVELLLSLKGRVAVTGMGKSGHVARKVAATLASTGTPAYFIHPAEASHGDLGMISGRDAVLAYSNSGETEEMESILLFCARRQVPVIGVTKRPASFLAAQSTVLLLLPDEPEACPIGCAPTTSTTMMMALGDALALCLLELKGFTPELFRQFHPGGRLGRRLLRASDIMHSGEAIPLVPPDAPMTEVLYTISGKRLGSTGVVEADGRLTGIITDGDLRRHMRPDFLSLTARDIMTPHPVTLPQETLAVKALALMQQRSITSIFIVDGDYKPLGLLHIHDCLKAGLE